MNAKSSAAAATLNDVFFRLGWRSNLIYAYPAKAAFQVAIQYKSPACGSVRSVIVDPIKLGVWIKRNMDAPGMKKSLFSLLDRKPPMEPERMPEPPELPLFP